MIGGAGQTGPEALAADAIKAVAAKWDAAHNWSFLLKDNYNTPITVTAGTGDYAAPSDFKQPYSARLLTSKRTLRYVHQRDFDRVISDQTVRRGSSAYTLYNSSGFTAAVQTRYVRLIPLPDADDTLLLRYYRAINSAADPIDIHDDYVYLFLEDCKAWLLTQKNADDSRAAALTALAARNLSNVISRDRHESEDEDVALKSQHEAFLEGNLLPGLSIDDYFPGGFPIG